MPLALQRKSTVPPNGYRFYVQETKRWVDGPSFDGLVSAVIHHLQTNKLPIPSNIAVVVEDSVCQMIPSSVRDMVCSQVPGDDQPPVMIERTLSWKDISNFLRVLAEWATGQREFVDAQVATERAETCATCPYNIQVAGCSGCHDIAAQLTGLVNGKETGLESKLRGCSVCACDNRAQVWFPLEVLAKGVSEDMQFPEWCWKKYAKK